MKTDVISCYHRERRWAAAKRFMQDLCVATGMALMFFAVCVLASESELFFEVVK